MPLCSHSENTVTYPVIGNEKDKRDLFVHDLLGLIFHEQQDFTLRSSKIMRENSKLIHLVARDQVDIGWASLKKDIHPRIRAIPYPIYRGLLGYRLIIVKSENKDKLAEVKNLWQLSHFSIGQGAEWLESRIFKINGLRVITSTGYEELFDMLRRDRFDLFPRSILEISEEINTFSKQDLIIDKHLMLHYPLAINYFVSKENTALAEFMDHRLNDLFISGDYDTLFQKHFEQHLTQFDFNNRTLIEIPNPIFPEISEKQKSQLISPQRLLNTFR